MLFKPGTPVPRCADETSLEGGGESRSGTLRAWNPLDSETSLWQGMVYFGARNDVSGKRYAPSHPQTEAGEEVKFNARWVPCANKTEMDYEEGIPHQVQVIVGKKYKEYPICSICKIRLRRPPR